MEDKHKLEKLAVKLNSRTNNVQAEYKKHELHTKNYETPKVWDDDLSSSIEDSLGNQMNMTRKIKNPFHKLLFGSFIFLAICLTVAGILIMGGGNTVSSDNINLIIGGPIQIGGGQELSLDVGIENKNSVPLQTVDVVIDYPKGTKTAGNNSVDLKRERINIGDVNSGQFAHKIFKSILFGEEGGTQEIKATIEYRVPGSNAIFQKEKTFSIVLNSSPVSITTKGLSEITSGQEASFEVTIASNSEKTLNNIVLKAEYPFGYSFKESSPKTSDGNDTWKISTLAPKETKTIKISGTLQGQNNEDRYFKFTLGNALASDDREVGTILALSSQVVSIKKSFLGVELVLNNSTADEFASSDGGDINSTIKWVNNTNEMLSNVEFIVLLSGPILDKSSVSVSSGGYYDSEKNIITWDRRTTENLSKVTPGTSGRLTFGFKVRNSADGDSKLKIDIGAKAQRLSNDNVEQQINSVVSRIVKLTTSLRLASKALYFTGPFENSGPIPPKAENETTYSIVWTVTNNLNNVSNTKVSAKLPAYVSWENVVSDSNEKISVNSNTGDISWDVGTVLAGAGFSKPKREVAFQVKLRPSITQVGKVPVLVEKQTLTGWDNYSNAQITDIRSALNTTLVGDTGFKTGDDSVSE